LRISLNLLADRLRSWRLEVAARRDLAALPAPAEPAQPALTSDPLMLVGVRTYVAGLPPAHQRVFQVRYVEGLSQRAAARRLGLSHQTLRTLENQMKDGLRLRLRGGREEEDS
jgi:DNA-directed RNA polymerase specialized sigma24 family protein